MADMFSHIACLALVVCICTAVSRSSLETKWRFGKTSGLKHYKLLTPSAMKGVGKTAKEVNSNLAQTKGDKVIPEHYRPIKSMEQIKLNMRTRREVRTLVEALKTNADKLENLTQGMAVLLKSVMQQTNEQSNITARLEHMNPLFVSLFVMLADVAFSSSPRIAKQHENVLNMFRYFRENILTNNDVMKFDEEMTPVITWYARSTSFNMTSCLEFRDSGFRISGVYRIQIPNSKKFIDVYCDQDTDGGGWLVIQRRQDGSEDFYRSWSDYQHGFGNIEAEFWLGNDNLYQLTRTSQEFRVDLMDFDGNTAYAKYSSFAVGSSASYFTLTISGYSGTAGDAMDYHNGYKFSTKDNDNDSSSTLCATKYKGAWWYGSCYNANLNGLYFNKSVTDNTSLNWYKWKGNNETLKKSEMKIRPRT